MCGRFQLSVKGKEISERFNVEVFNEMYSPSYNCAPSQTLPVITNSRRDVLSFFRWGYIPPGANLSKPGLGLINARSETISEKPAFKKAFITHRCLIPSNGFYEWRTGDKVPFRIFLKNEPLFSMAGIWSAWTDSNNNIINTFSIITTRANNKMSKIHHRMPVILTQEKEKEWLTINDEGFLKNLLAPIGNEKIDFYRISKKINSPKNNDAGVIAPESEGEQLELF